jgi:ferredoxin
MSLNRKRREEMSKRQIIEIDRNKCDGCGLCTEACAEGALALDEENKAYLAIEIQMGLNRVDSECDPLKNSTSSETFSIRNTYNSMIYEDEKSKERRCP